jgi:ferredoxin
MKLPDEGEGKDGGSVRVSVDFDTCGTFGVCMSICHEVFEVRDDGLHLLQEKPSEELRDKLKGAEVSCPTQAITVED